MSYCCIIERRIDARTVATYRYRNPIGYQWLACAMGRYVDVDHFGESDMDSVVFAIDWVVGVALS